MDRQMKRQNSEGGSQNTFVDHQIQYRISPWPKSAEKRGFRTGVTDGRTDGPTDGPTDRPSYRDAFLTDASKNANFQIKYENLDYTPCSNWDHATRYQTKYALFCNEQSVKTPVMLLQL